MTMKNKVAVLYLNLFGALLVSSASSQLSPSETPLTDLLSFQEFAARFDKQYTKDELRRRQIIYRQNLQRIAEHNSKISPGPYVLGVNQFADREPRELSFGYDKGQRRLQKQPLEDVEHRLGISLRDPVESLPSLVDWRTSGVTTPVKSQGQCGSCWAFASTAVLESHLAIHTGTLAELSVQELVSCVPNPKDCGGTGGCDGATAELAFEHVKHHGMVSEWQFGYQSFHPEAPIQCPLKPSNHDTGGNPKLQGKEETSAQRLRQAAAVRKDKEDDGVGNGLYEGAIMGIGGWVVLPSNNYVAVMNAVAKLGPLSVSVACHPWVFYKSGVFTSANFTQPKETDVNHLVVLEGYGTDEATGLDYWLVRNSWGPSWGEGGYIRLERTAHPRCGIDVTPADGVACTSDDNGQPVTPPNATICGNSGILFDVTVPLYVFEVPDKS